MKLISDDCGFAQTKFFTGARQGKFPSTISAPDSIVTEDMDTSSKKYTINGETLVVGMDALAGGEVQNFHGEQHNPSITVMPKRVGAQYAFAGESTMVRPDDTGVLLPTQSNFSAKHHNPSVKTATATTSYSQEGNVSKNIARQAITSGKGMAQEILTVEEFADRIKIGRSTLFNWISEGFLISGKHYFKKGRILLFVWDDNTIPSLLEKSAPTVVNKSVRPVDIKTTKNTKNPINWDC